MGATIPLQEVQLIEPWPGAVGRYQSASRQQRVENNLQSGELTGVVKQSPFWRFDRRLNRTNALGETIQCMTYYFWRAGRAGGRHEPLRCYVLARAELVKSVFLQSTIKPMDSRYVWRVGDQQRGVRLTHQRRYRLPGKRRSQQQNAGGKTVQRQKRANEFNCRPEGKGDSRGEWGRFSLAHTRRDQRR